MRGKGSISHSFQLFFGITPAYAGKRHTRWSRKSSGRDHPRLCGEKIRPQFNHFPNAGSPPPMRGKGKVCCLKNSCNGITPAYAGKSAVNESETTETEDHPRLCGEKTKKIPKQRYFFHQPASFSFSLQYT